MRILCLQLQFQRGVKIEVLCLTDCDNVNLVLHDALRCQARFDMIGAPLSEVLVCLHRTRRISVASAAVLDFAGEPGMALALEQMILNVVMSVAVLILLRIFHNRLDSLGVGMQQRAEQ